MITFYLVVTPDEQINASALYKISPFSQVSLTKGVFLIFERVLGEFSN